MTNQEITTELLTKSDADICLIVNLYAEQKIASTTEQEQDNLQAALSAEGVEVGVICQRKKSASPPST